MNNNTRLFIALAITMLLGAGYGFMDGDARDTYAKVAGPLVALTWIGYGILGGRSGNEDKQRESA